MRRAARVDANQAEIVQALRMIGAEVTPLHRVGQGVSDLLCSFRQKWFVLECKAYRGKMTPDQVDWIGRQKAPVYVVRNALEAISFLEGIA